jgi:serine/threonine-protein kinase
VFRAYDPERERLVAVKLFRLDLQPERVHRLVAELERLIDRAPAHPGLVAPLATGINVVTAYLAEEYVAAESLDVVLRQRRRASVEDSLRVAAQLAGALDAAAEAGLEHGALHPRDILLTADEAKLTGVGVARAFEAIGVPAPMRRPYTAPERAEASGWDRRADVFGLAALVYEMLSGRRLSGTDRDAVSALDDVSGANHALLGDVFERALARDPDQRFDTAQDFAEALAHAFERRQSAIGSQPPAVQGPQAALEVQVPFEPSIDEPTPALEKVVEPAPALAKVVEMGPLLTRRQSDSDWTDSHQSIPDNTSVPDGDRPRSFISPLAFAMFVGGALGFAAGFGVGVRRSDVLLERPAALVDEVTAATTGVAEELAAGAAAGQQPAVPAEPGGTLPAAAEPPSAAVVGSLLVRSTPAGARVIVDGREYGRTPLTVGGLTRGLHRVRVARDGFVSDERQLTITAGQRTHSVTVRLAPEAVAPARPAPATPPPAAGRGTGLLVVESRPAGARVFINGKLVGTTPLELPAVPAGEQAVHLERDGYRRWASAVRIVPSERNRVAASLDR